MGAGQCGAEPETYMFFLKSAGKVSKHFETKCPVVKNTHMLWQSKESYFTCLQDHLYVRDPVFQKLP